MRQLMLRNFAAKKDAIMGGKITAFLHYLSPQPPEGYEYRGAYNGKEMFADGDGAYFFAKAVYSPGEVAYIREGYYLGRDENGELEFTYQADDTGSNKNAQWKPASYMPIEAARVFLEITGTEIVRFDDLSKEAARATGAKGRQPQQQAREEWDEELRRNQDHMKSQTNPWMQVVYFRTIPRPEGLPEGVARVREIDTFYTYIVRSTKTGEVVAEGNSKVCAEIMGYTEVATFNHLVKRIDNGRCKKYTCERVKLYDREENESASGNDLAERNNDGEL